MAIQTSILAVPRHQRLGAKYAQIRSYTAAHEEFVNQHASYFSIARCVVCGCGPAARFLPPRSRDHIQFLIYRSISEFNARSPTKPPLVVVQSRAGATLCRSAAFRL